MSAASNVASRLGVGTSRVPTTVASASIAVADELATAERAGTDAVLASVACCWLAA